MRVRVEFAAQLRSVTDCKEDCIEMADGGTVGQLVAHLGEKYGNPVRAYLLNPAGELQRSLLVIVNGMPHPGGQAGAVCLADRDCVEFLPPIGGG
ncbi:MoaD/ThiS family protein [Schlesneria sp.]|uniref:MoaD/ThiS family protein n=1 Tax=Schlesneria sp. TaxID=2762018 RepID=UPI002EE36BE0